VELEPVNLNRKTRESIRRCEVDNVPADTFLHAKLDAAAMRNPDEVLADLAALEHSLTSESVTLKEAGLLGGYSVDHLQRLVSAGDIENVGRKGRPRIRRGDVPTKPGHALPSTAAGDQLDARRRIVASVATGQTEAS